MKKKILITAAVVAALIYISLNLSSPSSDYSYISPEKNNTVNNQIPADEKYGNSDIFFPRDYGSHNNFRTEWWYFSGNLSDKNGRKFGYEFTIFRNALAWNSTNQKFENDQRYMAHFALTDIAKNKFYYKDKFSLGTEGLAGASSSPLKFWLGDWVVQGNYINKNYAKPDFHIKAAAETYSIDLDLSSLKPVFLQGDNGISRKGPGTDNFSHYYSLTRISTAGKVKISGEEFEVSGFSWMDREWSNASLGRNEDGWDWFSIQLNNNSEIMFYQFHGKEKISDKYNQGVLILDNGKSEKLKAEDVKIDVAGYWESKIRNVYPSGWKFSIPKRNINLVLTPEVKDQELELLISYWEGSVSVKGTIKYKEVDGRGYVELTGY
ncbi:MAG: hypothetical protein NTX65_03540 [Ignavibacteriales bacterium]|nr:hypothetical protein [Ignavibacteriales bacterium]